MEIDNYKERGTTMYDFIKKFFTTIEPGLEDAFLGFERIFGWINY